MASPGGNSNSNSNSVPEEDLQQLMDQRKRKRMQSNKESARRSRMRKQQHLDDLVAQVSQLTNENNQILASINITTQHYLNVEAKNSVLRAQMMELGQRLDSLNDILNFLNTTATATTGLAQTDCFEASFVESFINPLNIGYLNQPTVASTDFYQY